MRNVLFGVLFVVCLIGIVVVEDAWRIRLHAQQPATRAQGELIAFSSDMEAGRQQVVVIDSKSRVMSVYHIEQETGVISLKSVRNIQADLLMDEFNTDSPLPKEIRAILEQR